MGMMKEFKEFAMRGNVIDMAVGIVIGGAFGKIVSSFVADVIMPPIGQMMGGVDFKQLKYILQEAVMEGEKVATAEVAIRWGSFVQTLIDFVIIAFAIFMVVRAMNNMKKKEEVAPEAPAAPPEPSKEELLLAEIRDELRKRA
ncbi:MAG TPA: large-conductance mechanosensitive channel protein MscL [Bacteroidetes bacterium]|nr:large-conductance mechanosensitive channel protein MscL [Bacteroidota bacterium]